MSSDTIVITGIDKVKLLHALWNNMKPASYFGSGLSPAFSQAEESKAVKSYFDYFCGHCIKTDLSNNYVNSYMYDRDAGAGKFALIVRSLRV